MTFVNKILGFIKRKKILSGVVVVVFIILGLIIFKNGKATNGTITISHTDFINQVSISGKVVASEEVDLGFNNGGRIARIFSSVSSGDGAGQIVKAGTLIATLDAKDAEQAVRDAEIRLESAKLSLSKLRLENSDENLSADLEKAYGDGFTAVLDSFTDLSIVIIGLEDILNDENLADGIVRNGGTTAQNYKNEAEKLFYKADGALKDNRKNFRLLDRNSPKPAIESIISETYETVKIFSNAVKSAKNLVDYLADDTDREADYASFKTILAEYTNDVSGHLDNLLSVQTNIKDQKDAFSSTGLDISDALLSVRQEENNLQDAKNKLADYYIRAPFDGIVTKIDAKIGEIASPNVPLVKMMSAGTFQVESYVPEVNIAQIKFGDEASITLDAYGEDVLFYAKVISIDPAETIRDGVSTYKIKLQFNTVDDRIKSGMTASVKIITFSKPNVVVIPGGVIFDKNGKKFVQVKINEEVVEKEVVLGMTSSLGQVEVISGLADGDKVVLNPEIK
ncbi:MAG: efflux RND transporter periplasmic adaptor subunit [Minisyncoccia bacterium]